MATTMSNDALIYKIEKILADPRATGYRIHKDTGIAYSRIDSIKHGDSTIDTLTLKTAIRIADWYDGLEKE